MNSYISYEILIYGLLLFLVDLNEFLKNSNGGSYSLVLPVITGLTVIVATAELAAAHTPL